MMKRLGVFVFYEKDGVVRRYVLHILEEIKKHLSELVIICNGKLSEEGRTALNEFTEELYVRENKGFDAGALKYYFCEKSDAARLEQLDEILIFNNTFYGPFGSFDRIFRSMDESDCDFWGITDYNETHRFPYHLQSYFVDFKSRLIHSGSFIEFWKGLKDDYDDLDECINEYETGLTRFFGSKGFKSGSFISNDLDVNVCFIHPYELMIRNDYPLIKRKLFVEYLSSGLIYNYEFNMVLEYVRENYNEEYLFMCEDAVSSFDICRIKQKTGLCIIPGDHGDKAEEFDIITNDPRFNEGLNKGSLSERSGKALCSIIYYPGKRGLSAGDELMLFDNVFRDMDHAGRISRIFTERPEIGCLIPECIINAEKLYEFGMEYVSYGAFWIRNSVLRELTASGTSYEDLAAMDGNSLARLIQKQGYFTYAIKNKEYADAENVMKDHILNQLLFHLEKNHDFNSLSELINRLHGDRLHGKRIKKMIKDKMGK